MMTGGEPDVEDVHAAGERDHGIVGDAQQDQTRATHAAKLMPDGNGEQRIEMKGHSDGMEFTRIPAGLRQRFRKEIFRSQTFG